MFGLTHRLSDDYVSHYRQYGFGLARGVIAPEEAEDLRDTCRKVWDETGGNPGDVFSHASLRKFALDERVLKVARAVLGPDLVYFGDSSFGVQHKRERILHTDAKADPDDPSRSDYPIVRFGFYLQDHVHHSDGLKLRPGSHRTLLWTPRNLARVVLNRGTAHRIRPAALKPTPFFNVPSRAGDLVFWNLRTHHVGHAVRLSGLERLSLPPEVENVIERYLPTSFMRPLERDRYALFMSLGAPSAALDRYIAERSASSFNREFWKRCSFNTPEAVESSRARGVVVRTDALDKNASRSSAQV